MNRMAAILISDSFSKRSAVSSRRRRQYWSSRWSTSTKRSCIHRGGLSAVAGEGFDTDASLAWILSEPSAPVDSVISAAAQVCPTGRRSYVGPGSQMRIRATGQRAWSLFTSEGQDRFSVPEHAQRLGLCGGR
jgi:hypothetical protein